VWLDPGLLLSLKSEVLAGRDHTGEVLSVAILSFQRQPTPPFSFYSGLCRSYDVPPVGGLIGSLVLGEMGRDQKETGQNAIGQFLDVHTFQHGLSSQCYALAEDPIADFGLDQVRGSKREWPCEEQGGRFWSLLIVPL
jgi:hypothetical protein